MTSTFVSALLLAAVHLLAGHLRALNELPRSRWLSAAGGVSVGYVFIHLLPELAHGQQIMMDSKLDLLGYLERHAYLLALIGLTTFYALERTIKIHRSNLPDTAHSHPGVFWLHIVAFAGYNALIGYLLAHRGDDELIGLIWYTVAMALHFLVNDVAIQSDHKHAYTHWGRWLLAVSTLAGWGVGTSTELSELATSAATAFIAGAIILNVLKEELPAERDSRLGAFLGGALGYSLLLLLAA